jgi:ribulose bisphosphate carboxylase small subunit
MLLQYMCSIRYCNQIRPTNNMWQIMEAIVINKAQQFIATLLHVWCNHGIPPLIGCDLHMLTLHES